MQDAHPDSTRAGAAAKENRRSSVNASGAAAGVGGGGKGAASGVSAMRAFWETAGQEAEKPRTGASLVDRSQGQILRHGHAECMQHHSGTMAE